MVDATLSYKCPNCDAALAFNADSGKFACEFCMSSFTEEELSHTDSAERAKIAEEQNTEFSSSVNEYHCPSCGAEIITDKDTAADFCYYCHSPVVLSDKVSGALRPSKVIPFSFDKKSAKEAFLRYTKKKKFLPKDYFVETQAEKISGIYYPYWVTDADTTSRYTATAHRVRRWTAGGYRYTEVTDYLVKRGGSIHFEDLSTSALSSEDKKMLEGILPYPIDAYEDFSMPYLLGFSAKKRDIDRESVSGEVRGRMEDYAKSMLRETIVGYTSVDSATATLDMNVHKSHWEYALLPIWILTYHKQKRNKTKVYTYAMNGYTGKVYGELPVSLFKLLSVCGALFLSLTLILTLLGRLLF